MQARLPPAAAEGGTQDPLARALTLLAASDASSSGAAASGGVPALSLESHSAMSGQAGVVTLGLSLPPPFADAEGSGGELLPPGALRELVGSPAELAKALGSSSTRRRGAPAPASWSLPIALEALRRVLEAGGADDAAVGAAASAAVLAPGASAAEPALLVFDLAAVAYEGLRRALAKLAADSGAEDAAAASRLVSALVAPLTSLPAAVKADLLAAQGGAASAYSNGVRRGGGGGGGRSGGGGGGGDRFSDRSGGYGGGGGSSSRGFGQAWGGARESQGGGGGRGDRGGNESSGRREQRREFWG